MEAVSNGDAESRPEDRLNSLHVVLEGHFGRLRERRDETAEGFPIFALEHGLGEAELAQLKDDVGGILRLGALPRASWLPLVVYATEIGYEYSGDEYWQTFEARTPGWTEHGDRGYIRRKFNEFKDQFGGAQPTGAWARHRSIICWPITHAVLPTDLQRHLARLLFDYRRALTSDLLADPEELGRSLAARSWQASSRFQAFAENPNLLGQVAASLLVGDDEESPYLLTGTLNRIVSDLSKEREAARWLKAAKLTTMQVRTRGLQSVPRGLAERIALEREAGLPVATDPEVSLRKESTGWSVYMELPDFSTLMERLPAVADEVKQSRALFAGYDRPLPRGGLLYPGRKLRLSRWPATGEPLISVENGSYAVNSLLADQCVLSSGPNWLFRVRDPGSAAEVRGKFLRPGHQYVLLSLTLRSALPAWMRSATCGASGIYAYDLDVPSLLTPQDIDFIKTIGLGTVTDVALRPAGLIPALWDGEGAAEWIAGERPIVGLSSTRNVGHCAIKLDGESQPLAWPTGEAEIFLDLGDLPVGAHKLDVALAAGTDEIAFAEGSLVLSIRHPPARPSTGSHREGLVIFAAPVHPTLTELWDGTASITVLGPAGAPVKIEVSLTDRRLFALSHRSETAGLPISPDEWRDLFASRFRDVEEVYRAFDEAESCLVTISEPGLGRASLRFEREFSPFRWSSGRDSAGPFVRLIDNTEGQAVVVRLFEFAHPDRSITLDATAGAPLRMHNGGLIVAQSGESVASVVLAPVVRTLDELREINVLPQLDAGTKSVAEIEKIIDLAAMWDGASLPGNPVGAHRRSAVLRAITGGLAGLIGGQRWAALEARIAEDDVPSISELQDGIGEHQRQRVLGAALWNSLETIRSMVPEERARYLTADLARYARETGLQEVSQRMVEFLLRIGSAPASLGGWPRTELRSGCERVVESPVLLRAARFVVLGMNLRVSGDESSPYGAWLWQ